MLVRRQKDVKQGASSEDDHTTILKERHPPTHPTHPPPLWLLFLGLLWHAHSRLHTQVPLFWLSTYEGYGELGNREYWSEEQVNRFRQSGARFLGIDRMARGLLPFTKGEVENIDDPHFCLPGEMRYSDYRGGLSGGGGEGGGGVSHLCRHLQKSRKRERRSCFVDSRRRSLGGPATVKRGGEGCTTTTSVRHHPGKEVFRAMTKCFCTDRLIEPLSVPAPERGLVDAPHLNHNNSCCAGGFGLVAGPPNEMGLLLLKLAWAVHHRDDAH